MNLTKLQKYLLVLLIAISDSVASFETEINIPSFPDMIKFYNVSEAYLQWIVNANLLGICISGLFFGPLSDKYGRRKPLLWGFSVFAIGAILCVVFIHDINLLILARFIQGLGLSSIFVIGLAIIFDIFDKEEAVKIMCYMSTIITLGMAASPILGSYINIKFGWEYNFYIIAVLAILLLIIKIFFLKETNTHVNADLSFKNILQDYKLVCLDKKSLGAMTMICVIMGAYMVFVANLSLIYIRYLKVTEYVYGFHQAINLLVFGSCTILCGYVIKLIGYVNTRKIGMFATFIGALCLCLVTMFIPKNPNLITLAMCIVAIGNAFLWNIVYGDYMEINFQRKGVASALINTTRLLYSVFCIYLSGIFFDGSILPVTIIISINILVCALLYFIIYRNNKNLVA